MQPPVKQRLEEFIEYKNLSCCYFEKLCHLGNGYVKKIRDSITIDKLIAIVTTFPELNANWLIAGIGPMLLTPQTIKEIAQEGVKLLNGEPNNFACHLSPIPVSGSNNTIAYDHSIAMNGSNITIDHSNKDSESDCENEVEALKNQIMLLNDILAEKERTIQILMKQNGNE